MIAFRTSEVRWAFTFSTGFILEHRAALLLLFVLLCILGDFYLCLVLDKRIWGLVLLHLKVSIIQYDQTSNEGSLRKKGTKDARAGAKYIFL